MKKFILILAFCISCAQTDDTINTLKTINYDVVNIHQTDYVPWSMNSLTTILLFILSEEGNVLG